MDTHLGSAHAPRSPSRSAGRQSGLLADLSRKVQGRDPSGKAVQEHDRMRPSVERYVYPGPIMAHVVKKRHVKDGKYGTVTVSPVRSGSASAARGRWKAAATSTGHVFEELAEGRVVAFIDDRSGDKIEMTWVNV